MASKIQLRRDSSADWTTINPVLAEGEVGFETNTGKFKIGNGSSAWSALDYFLDSSDLSTYLTASSASTTYLTQASASTTYLTQTSASSTYPTIGTLNSGLVSASAAAVAYLVDSAPGALDTLNELAAAINDDSSFATTVTNALAAKAPLSPSTNAQTGSTYTLILTDAGKYVEMNNASSNTLTVPLNASVAFPIGTEITIIQTGAGTTTISPAGGVTVNYYSLTGAGTRTIKAQWAAATLIKRAENTWVLIGNLG
jgi:hypothetical protein